MQSLILDKSLLHWFISYDGYSQNLFFWEKKKKTEAPSELYFLLNSHDLRVVVVDDKFN